MNDLETAKPADSIGEPTGSGGDVGKIEWSIDGNYNRYSPSMSIDALLPFADLHESLAFFYLDKATAVVDGPAPEFLRWYGPCIDCLTWCEILRSGRVGLDVN